jgi:hypothetical protein
MQLVEILLLYQNLNRLYYTPNLLLKKVIWVTIFLKFYVKNLLYKKMTGEIYFLF